ncbi:PaaI family thioesterase [uncultured Photobacterium sp.]|uniref:PaaI family thioesterase n=1 Tax=uncultured Photobacterium sp. TaxID=173973 RepID=UPI00261EAC0B|nr:PaaI family thioesterase [uncultured Photobacterium sp.]
MMDQYQVTKQAHDNCIACGRVDHNPDSLGLAFTLGPDGTVTAPFKVSTRYQGYDGLLHGGMISTLLDAAMTHCLFAQGIQALTAELTVRFSKPVEVGQEIMLKARILGQRGGIYQLEARITQGRQLLARGKAKFIEPK